MLDSGHLLSHTDRRISYILFWFLFRKRHKKNAVYVATIEKANSLTNSLIELQRISDLGLVVTDEV